MLCHYYSNGIPEFPKYQRALAPYSSLNSPEQRFPQYVMPENYLSTSLPEAYKSKTEKSGNIVEEIFGDKVQSLRATIDSILAQIEERKTLRKSNLHGILQGECKCDTELMQLEDRIGFSNAGPGTDKARATIQKELLNLERERRFEEVSCWRDLVFLRKELLNTLREYQTAVRRQEMLSTK
jgi:hypothetical protein